MRAVLLRETGGPERLELAEVPEPEAGEGEVVVRVRAAGVNFADVLVRQGRYPQPPELPTVPGSEIAGEVDGRRVMALPRGSGYAEAVAVDEQLVVPLPDGASFEEGAGLKPLGSVVAIGFAGGWWNSLDPAPLVGRNLGMQGFYLGRLMRHEPALVQDAVGELLELWSSGAVKPLVGATFPLADAGAAHELIESRGHVGKVVLVP